MGLLGYYRDKETIKSIILALAQKRRQVIYGQQSVNVQLPAHLKKETSDYDILTRKSRQAAEELVHELNKEYGAGKFTVVVAKHPGTFKVKDTSGETIADYTQTTKKPGSVGVLGVRYAGLHYQQAKIRKSLRNEAMAFRHEKDIDVRRRIKEGTRKWLAFRGAD